jgi:hypothetical protein
MNICFTGKREGRLMNRMYRLKILMLIIILFLSSMPFFISNTANAAPSGIIYQAPITITNSQSSATPNPFEQMIKIPISQFSSYIFDNNTSANFEFYYSNNTIIPAWIESVNGTTIVVWLKLYSIPASSSITIYMGFASKSTNLLSNSGTTGIGEAPQLSPTYAKYDDGAKVFNNYWNFSGTSTPSGINVYTGYGSVTFNNGATIKGGTSGSGGENGIATSISFSQPIAVDYYGTQSTSPSGDYWGWNMNGFSNYLSGSDNFPSSGGTYTLINFENGVNAAPETVQGGTSTKGGLSTPSNNLFPKSVWTCIYTSSAYYTYQNYSSSTGYVTGASNTASLPFEIEVGNNEATYAPNGMTVYWLRTRAYPPNGVMPTVTFGSVISTSSGYQISFYQTSLPSTVVWGIRLNNTTKIWWFNTSGEYNNFTGLPNGNYYYQVINATGYYAPTYKGEITINNANVSQLITFKLGYSVSIKESGLPMGTKWYANISKQPGLAIGTWNIASTTQYANFTDPNGSYSFTIASSNKYYYSSPNNTLSFTISGTSLSLKVYFVIKLYYVNFTSVSKPSNVYWRVKLNTINASIYSFNQTKFSNSTVLSFKIPNGTWYYNATATNSSGAHIGWWKLTNSSTWLLWNVSTFKGVKFIVNGKNIKINITFQRAYNISIVEQGIGTKSWWVNFDGWNQTVNLSKTFVAYFTSTQGNYTNGSYSLLYPKIVSGTTGVRYQNWSSITSITISGKDVIKQFNYITQYYLTTASVPAQGGYHSPNSGWYNASTEIKLTASPNASYEFSGFEGFNATSYSGMGTFNNNQYSATITIGGPVTEYMTFNNYIVLTFYLENAPKNIWWGVKLYNNSNLVQWVNSSTQYSFYIVFDIPQGKYTYYITNIPAYPQSNTISVSVSTEILIRYNMTTYPVTFTEKGLPLNFIWGAQIYPGSMIQYSTSSQNIFYLPNGSYSYFVYSIQEYSAKNGTGKFNVSGHSVLINISFYKPPTFFKQGISGFVPIYVTTADFSIPINSQIPIDINWSKYSQYLDPNLQNVLIVDSNFNPLFSWIETNASSSARNSIVWVKLNQTILPYQNITLYILIYNKTTNNFNPLGYWGEAPQLSPQFNEYNNIAMVMNKGLLVQIYTDPSAPYLNSLPSPNTVQNANVTQGSTISYLGNNYQAQINPYLTPLEGSTQEVYYDGTLGIYTFGVANNVIINYQTIAGDYPGNWPSPPIISTSYAQTWFAKAQGFIFMNQSSTSFYTLDDDGTYIVIGSDGIYLNNNWGNGNIIINDYGSNTPTNTLGGTFNEMGIYQISILYGEIDSGEALWQVWTSSPVQYYSPSPIQSVPQITFGTLGYSYFVFKEYGLPQNVTWAVTINGQILESNTSIVYGYLPYGAYVYSVGQYNNGTFSVGYIQVGSTSYIPAPQQGFLTVNSIFIIQVITFTTNKVLQYQISPQLPQVVKRSNTTYSFDLPLYISNYQGLPANSSVIALIEKNLTAQLISAQTNQNLTFNISKVSYGLIVIFMELNISTIEKIQNGSSIVSFFSEFKYGTMIDLATGIAGPTIFATSQFLNNTKNYYILKFENYVAINSTVLQVTIYSFYLNGTPTNLSTTQAIAKNLTIYYISSDNSTILHYTIVSITAGVMVIQIHTNIQIEMQLLSGQSVLGAKTTVTPSNNTNTVLQGNTLATNFYLSGLSSWLFVLDYHLFTPIFYKINLWTIIIFLLIILVPITINRKTVKKSITLKHSLIALYTFLFGTMIILYLMYLHGVV